MKYNIEEKVQKLTTIEDATLKRLNNLVECCIVDAVYESVLANDDCVEVDLDFCKIIISKSNNELRYKFVPSAKLEENIVKAIKEKKNSLDDIVLDKLKSSLLSTYKDLF